jgi:hypothetical protein
MPEVEFESPKAFLQAVRQSLRLSEPEYKYVYGGLSSREKLQRQATPHLVDEAIEVLDELITALEVPFFVIQAMVCGEIKPGTHPTNDDRRWYESDVDDLPLRVTNLFKDEIPGFQDRLEDAIFIDVDID